MNPLKIWEEPFRDDQKQLPDLSVDHNYYSLQILSCGHLHLIEPNVHHADARWNIFTVTWKRSDGEQGALTLNIPFMAFGPRHYILTINLFICSEPDMGDS